MPPYVIDANILVRLATFDIPELAHQARSLLQPMADESVELPLYILAEVVYVLAYNTNYQYPRSKISDKLLIISSFPQFTASRETIRQTLEFFATTKLDFVDCLLLAKHQLHNQTVLTFDKALLRKLKAA